MLTLDPFLDCPEELIAGIGGHAHGPEDGALRVHRRDMAPAPDVPELGLDPPQSGGLFECAVVFAFLVQSPSVTGKGS